MLQNARVTALLVSELLRENQQGGRNLSQVFKEWDFNLKVKLTFRYQNYLLLNITYFLYF